MTLIREGGELVAVVGHTRAYLLPHVELLPEADPLRRRTLAKCLYALAIATGRRPGIYRELEAEAYACRLSTWPPAPAGRGLRPARPCVARRSRGAGKHAAPTRQEARWPPRPPRRPDARSAS